MIGLIGRRRKFNSISTIDFSDRTGSDLAFAVLVNLPDLPFLSGTGDSPVMLKSAVQLMRLN